MARLVVWFIRAPLRYPVLLSGAGLSGSDSGPGMVTGGRCRGRVVRAMRGAAVVAGIYARGLCAELVPVVWPELCAGDLPIMGGAGGRRRENDGPVMGRGSRRWSG